MTVLQGCLCIELVITASGTVPFPTYLSIGSADDYRIVVDEGTGSVDDGSRTTTGFDFTVVAGPCKVLVFFVRTNVVAHVS